MHACPKAPLLEEDIPRLAITSATDDAVITATRESHLQRSEGIMKNGDEIGIAHNNGLVTKPSLQFKKFMWKF